MQSLSKISYEVDWTGSSPVGTLALQVSNTYAIAPDGSVGSVGTWTAVPMDVSGVETTTISISGSTGNGFIDVTMHAGYACRLLYTKVSGTGTMTAVVNGKVA